MSASLDFVFFILRRMGKNTLRLRKSAGSVDFLETPNPSGEPKNVAHTFYNQPQKTPHAPPRITYSSSEDHRSSPTTTYTTILLRLRPTSPMDRSKSDSKVAQRRRRHPIRSGRDGGRDHPNCDAHEFCVSHEPQKVVARNHHILRYVTQSAMSIIINHLTIEYHFAGFLAFLLTPASCQRHSRTVATPLRLWCAQPRYEHTSGCWFLLLVFTETCGPYTRRHHPAINRDNQCR